MLLEEFQSRYAARLRPAHGDHHGVEAEEVAREIGDVGGQVAMFVTDSRLPDVDHIFEAIHRWRVVVPTARRVIAAHWDYFLADGPGLRIGLAKGKYDAYLLMPRGKRDEEFHNAITDLLSDWTSTVPQPEVVTAKIISPTPRRADHGDPRLPRPDGNAEPGLAPRRSRAPGLSGRDPGAAGRRGAALARRRGRQPSARSRPRASATWRSRSTAVPTISRSTRSSTSRSSAAGRPGWRRRSTAPPRGSRSSSSRPRRSAARPAPAR